MPESNLHSYGDLNPQMLSQEEFQELHFVPDPVLGDDGMYLNVDALIWYLKNAAEKKTCVYCNPTDPLYNSPSVNLFPHFSRYIHKTKQKLAIRLNEINKYKVRRPVANFNFFPLWIQMLEKQKICI